MVSVAAFADRSARPLLYLEVKPCLTDHTGIGSRKPSVLAAAVKVHLLNWICHVSLSTGPKPSLKLKFDEYRRSSTLGKGKIYSESTTKKDEQSTLDNENELLLLPQLDPNLSARWPCECYGYVEVSELSPSISTVNVIVNEDTMVRVLSDCCSVLDHLTGELPKPIGHCITDFANHNPETINELRVLFRRLMIEPVMIGSAPGISSTEKSATFGNGGTSQWDPPKCIDFYRDGALRVLSSNHGAGKTNLVEQIARDMGCSRVHIVRIGSLISKHGVHADTALETTLHQVALSAAIDETPICIIIDNLSSMIPPAVPTMSDGGDAAISVLNAIAAYLRMLTHSIYHDKIFPFPVKNRLYNVHATKAHNLPLRLCLVAVDTDPNGSPQQKASFEDRRTNSTDLMVATTYRLPALKAETRNTAFQNALDREGVSVSPFLQMQLPYLAASAVWARGRHFQQVARYLRQHMGQNQPATLSDFTNALNHIQKSCSFAAASANVEFVVDKGQSTFAAVGGNAEAKSALEEAVALDETKRKFTTFFGIEPPTGVLLYGPPGCGKTLMAKAVAKMLKGTSITGGAFVSINTTDVARAEVGTGEKLLSSAFESARLNAPAVIFIDEFQALFTERHGTGSSRLTSTLLSAMDDCKKWAESETKSKGQDDIKKRVIILAATNTPWMIDKAFLRPGRFDRIVHVGLPNTQERLSILKLCIGKMKTPFGYSGELEDICKELAGQTDGFSGADLAAMCRSAAVQCLLENCDSVEEKHFKSALQVCHGSSSVELVERIKRWSSRSS